MYCFQVLTQNFSEFQSTEQAIEEIADHYGYLSDSDLEDDEDEKVASPNHETNPVGDSDGEKIGGEDHEEQVEKGKVVKIPDMAFVT